MKNNCEIGLVGLAVMGENLALNMANKGYSVSVWDRFSEVRESFIAKRAKGKDIHAADSMEIFVTSIAKPRKILLMVRAGDVVDLVIDQLLPFIEPGDIIIDGGNSHYKDTNRRTEALAENGLLYVGAGISGGEEGALNGPSIMPGGNLTAWPAVKPILQAIAATVNDEPCCEWIGEGGAGHFIKMVHNGIEYADMQLICEAYQLMKDVGGFSYDEMHEVFDEWNKGDLSSYLIEITRDIMAYREDGEPLLEKILDTAGQKGTGKWTGIIAQEMGVPLTLISEAVYARCISSQKQQRVDAASILSGPEITFSGDKKAFLASLGQALLSAKIVSYAQGFSLMHEASTEFNWALNYGNIAKLWRGGCIIRSSFLDNISQAYDNNPDLVNLLLDNYFSNIITQSQQGWRQSVATAVMHGIPCPTMGSALSYFDAYRSARLPANLLQAQRDYFGAHTYERTDKPRGQYFHTNWTGRGGDTSSSTYDV